MKDRLIELLEKAIRYADENYPKRYTNGMYCKLMAESLLSEGVIVPPVKVGQTVWFVRNVGDKSREKIEETQVEKIVVKRGGLYMKLGCNSMYETTCNSIGKTVFLTREEAEKVLNERSEK